MNQRPAVRTQSVVTAIILPNVHALYYISNVSKTIDVI